MDVWASCEKWYEEGKYEAIVDALEAIAAERRTPAMDRMLAEAYIALGLAGDPSFFHKALRVLLRHGKKLETDGRGHFLIGTAWYHLGNEGRALTHFTKAQELAPCKEAQSLAEECREHLLVPSFSEPFRQRVMAAWAAFAEKEGELRRMMDASDDSGQIVTLCEEILRKAFLDAAFELRKHDGRYELILTPEGDWARTFPLAYFCRYVPAAVRDHWDVRTGYLPQRDFAVESDGWQVSADGVECWAEPVPAGRVELSLYAPGLRPLMKLHPGKARWMLSVLTERILGEVCAMSVIADLHVLDAPKEGRGFPMRWLVRMLEEMEIDTASDPEYCLNKGLSYTLSPIEDREADWRLDIRGGYTLCAPLINDYLNGRSDTADAYHADGICAGFFVIPLEEKSENEFRDFLKGLEADIQKEAGVHAVSFIGQAIGLYAGYLDFIAWDDLRRVLQAAQAVFWQTELPWAAFHSFRRDVGAVRILNREEETAPAADTETGSLLSREAVELLESRMSGIDGYFYQMAADIENYIEKGTADGRFTRRQAWEDLQISLWYGYACNNIDAYPYYARAARQMRYAERQAKGCGTWYYRYSAALMHCGRLEEALRYAEKGIIEEPAYPWGWLQAGKLRAHFGDRAGALEAAAAGLSLVPGDYEFLMLEKEIQEEAALAEMEYHWIDPGSDGKLQAGEDADGAAKRRTNACMVLHPERLEAAKALFHPADWTADAPYCSFHDFIQGHAVEVVFRMNEAGLSSMPLSFLRRLKEMASSGAWLRYAEKDGVGAGLDTILVDLDETVTLLYKTLESGEYIPVEASLPEE